MKNYNGNVDSAVNQNIKRELVEREIKACISDFAESLFDWEGNAYGSWEEWDNLFDENDEPQEIYEYWLVTDWFGEKLRDHGEPVYERWGSWIWGRTCSGQAILLDSVVSEIAADMGILEGQENDWSRK